MVLLSREWRIQPVLGGGCSTVLGVSVHTTLLMQGCHRRPVSVFGGILSLLLSVCRMQSAFQWSSPETPTCGILTSTSLDPDCTNVPIMASCRLELCNRPDRATHISGAGLDCIFISSGHVVFWSVSSHTSRPSAWTNVPPLRDWRPTLIRAHAELLQQSARVCASPVHPPEDSCWMVCSMR